MNLTAADIARFNARFERATPGHCWRWTYHAGHAGHGRMWAAGKNTLASHIALELAGKPRPNSEACALHSCDNPSCVNPSHLRWGTQIENIKDRVDRQRNGAALGTSNGSAKLDPSLVREIRADGRLLRQIATQFGISPVTVSLIKRRKIWRHVA